MSSGSGKRLEESSLKTKRSVSWSDVPRLQNQPSTSRAVIGTGNVTPCVEAANAGNFQQVRGDFESAILRYDLTKQESVKMPNMSKRNHGRSENSEHAQRLTAFGVSLTTTLSDVVLVYPCLVLRRQCQVNNVGRKYHYTPFTIIAVAVNLQRSQGFTCLWKGIGSHLTVNALMFGVETAISESSPKLPREIHIHSKMKDVIGHLILKVLSAAVTLPFYSAHLVESIQSEAASESPGLFYCITEGFSRLFGFAGVQSRRMLPFRYLLTPTVLHFLLRYILISSLQYSILYGFRLHEKWRHDRLMNAVRQESPSLPDYMSMPATSDDVANEAPGLDGRASRQASGYAKTQNQEIFSSFLSQLVADVLLYPFECVIYRLHIQGTRTIIDDMDRGSGFLPVSSGYEGFVDCMCTVKAQEGVGGLYKGFGALVLQHSFKFGILKLVGFVLKMSHGFQ